MTFQSTLPLRGATPIQARRAATLEISIHAPLAGSDAAARWKWIWKLRISIHAPLAGSDATTRRASRPSARFQSTLPLRGATGAGDVADGRRLDFNPRSPCGERRRSLWRLKKSGLISIHAPLAGSDINVGRLLNKVNGFQSTLPLRGATAKMSKLQGVRLEEIVRFVV